MAFGLGPGDERDSAEREGQTLQADVAPGENELDGLEKEGGHVPGAVGKGIRPGTQWLGRQFVPSSQGQMGLGLPGGPRTPAPIHTPEAGGARLPPLPHPTVPLPQGTTPLPGLGLAHVPPGAQAVPHLSRISHGAAHWEPSVITKHDDLLQESSRRLCGLGPRWCQWCSDAWA